MDSRGSLNHSLSLREMLNLPSLSREVTVYTQSIGASRPQNDAVK